MSVHLFFRILATLVFLGALLREHVEIDNNSSASGPDQTDQMMRLTTLSLSLSAAH